MKRFHPFLVLLALLAFPGCGETSEKQAKFGRPRSNFDMALGTSRRFDFEEGETAVETVGDEILMVTPLYGDKQIGVVLSAMKPGDVALGLLKGKATSQIFKVVIHEAGEKAVSAIEEQIAFEKSGGIPARFEKLSLGKCLAISSPAQTGIGSFHLTTPSVASATREKSRVNVCGLKAGFTDVTVYDEQSTVIVHLFVQVVAP